MPASPWKKPIAPDDSSPDPARARFVQDAVERIKVKAQQRAALIAAQKRAR
jgi:hypothetical protein